MADWLDAMEAAGGLVFGCDRYSPEVRAELLRNLISVRKAGDEVEAEPRFFEVDTVAHCAPSLKGDFARRSERH